MALQKTPPPTTTTPSMLFSFDDYIKGRGWARTTGYRYRQRGLLVTINIFGRLYITADEIKRFENRAISVEFSSTARLS